MSILRSIVFVFIGSAALVACGTSVAVAQTGNVGSDGNVGTALPPPPPSSDVRPPEGAYPPPPPGGSYPPPPSGSFDRGSYPPTGDFRPPEGGMYPPSGDRPMPMPQPSGSGEFRGDYRGYEPRGEFGRPPMERRDYPEQGMRLQDEHRRPYSGSDDFRPEGRPFTEGDSRAQGRPFKDEGYLEGRPFGGGSESRGSRMERGSWGGPNGGSDQGGFEQGGMEERGKDMSAQQLSGMKRGVSGMEQGVRQMQKSIERLKKAGIAVPADAESTLQTLTGAISTLKSATEMNEQVEAAMDVLQDSDMSELGRTLGMLEQMQKVTSQVEKELARLDKELTKLKKKKDAAQYPAMISKAEAGVNEAKSLWQSVKSEASGDAEPEDIMESIQEIFELTQQARQTIQFALQISSVTKMLKSSEKEIAQFEKNVARLAKKGANVSSVQGLIAEGKAKMAELRTLASASDVDPEAFMELMQELEAIRQEAFAAFEEAGGATAGEQYQSAVLQSIKARRSGI